MLFGLFLFVSFLLHGQEQCLSLFETKSSLASHSSMMGRDRLRPTDPLFRYYQQQIQALFDIRQLPSLPWSDFSQMTKLNAGGLGNIGIYSATYQSQQVAIKIYNPKNRDAESQLLHEVKVLLELNKLNQGIEVIGFTESPEGHLALVTALETGINVSLDKTSYQNIKNKVQVTREMLIQVQRLGSLLERIGFYYTGDMQLFLTSDGRALLIDTEFFFKQTPYPLPLGENMVTHPLMAALEHYNMLLAVYRWQQSQRPPPKSVLLFP